MVDEVEEFHQHFQELAEQIKYLFDHSKFKEDHGFSLAEYIAKGKQCAFDINLLANHIEKVAHDTGVAKTVGGGLEIASGVLAIGGIIAAPITAGTSLALTAGVITVGVAGTATTFAAGIVKERDLSAVNEDIKKSIDDLKEMEEIKNEEFAKLKISIEKLRLTYQYSEVQDILKNIRDGVKLILGAKNAYDDIKHIIFIRRVANFIQADFYANEGIAIGMVAPEIRVPIFGKVLARAGSTTAKVLSSAFAVANIGFGIWHVVEGVEDINGSDHAKAYREAAKNIFKLMNVYEEFERNMKNQVWFTIRNKQSGLVLDIQDGNRGDHIITRSMTDGGDSQLWKWHEDGKTIVSKLGYVLDAAIHGSEEKTKICVWDHHGGVNQQWIMIGDKICSVWNGMCLEIPEYITREDENYGEVRESTFKQEDIEINLWPLNSNDEVDQSWDHQSWELVYEGHASSESGDEDELEEENEEKEVENSENEAADTENEDE